MSDYLNSLTYLEEPLDMKLLEPFKNLIYIKLDLPDVPNFDQELFKDWCRDNYREVVKPLKDRAGSERFPSKSKINPGYPWKTAWIYGIKNNDNPPWYYNFDTVFPDLVRYIEHYPIDQLEDIGAAQILMQKILSEVGPHTDPDPWFGIRTYLSDEKKDERAKLYFCPSYNDLEEHIPFWKQTETGFEPNKMSDFFDVDNKKIVQENYGKFSCMFNSVRAAHGVEKHMGATGERALLLVAFKRLNSKKLKDLLERSIARYPNTAIWR
jgi:hypothetical protein